MSHSADDDVSSHIKKYLFIGTLLCVFTIITVALSFVDFSEWGLGTSSNMIIGMLVATFKASLVCLIFMHLNHEKKLIYKFLAITTAFAIVLFSLFLFAKDDPLVYGGFEKVKPKIMTPTPAAEHTADKAHLLPAADKAHH
jgi:caa(3)-type oxidase subunit IV